MGASTTGEPFRPTYPARPRRWNAAAAVALICATVATGSVYSADAGPNPNAVAVELRTADGPERPEWFPILGDAHVRCTTGNPNAQGIRDGSCHQHSESAGDVIAYHPWPAVDLAVVEGTPVRATGAGTVLSVGHTTSEPEPDALATDVSDEALAARAGGWIVVAHADGPNSVYKHVADWLVAPGDHVEPGQILALVGYPGTRTSHLHYDEQDPQVRFNQADARVPLGSMRAFAPDGTARTYPAATGVKNWADVRQQTVVGSHGWGNTVRVGSEAAFRAAVEAFAATSEDGPFTIALDADMTLLGGPLDYRGDELLMIDGDPDLDGERRQLTAAPSQRVLRAPDPDAAIELRGVELVGSGGLDGDVDGDGGLVDSAGPITLVRVDASGGSATADGGAFRSGEWISVIASEIHDNTAGGAGGAISAARTAVADSTLQANTARTGGAIAAAGPARPGRHLGGDRAQTDGNRISNSTLSANVASSGAGAVDAAGDLYVQNSTLHLNQGRSVDTVALGGTLTVSATALSTDRDGVNCAADTVRSLGGSLDSGTSCGLNGPFDIVDEPALLGSLRLNGGPTRTHYPLTGSPLVDAFTELPGEVKGLFEHAPHCSPSGRSGDQRAAGTLDPLPGRSGNGDRFSYPDPSHGGLDQACDIGAVEAVYPPHAYEDVPVSAREAVRWISSESAGEPRIMGRPTTAFEPRTTVTRSELANVLYGFAGRPSVVALPHHGFPDVPSWVDDAVRWMVGDTEGSGPRIITGSRYGTFAPDDPLTHGQLARALHHLTGELPVTDREVVGLPSVDVPDWLRDPVRWATQDRDGSGPAAPVLEFASAGRRFEPNRPITRAQVARALEVIAEDPALWNRGDGRPVDPTEPIAPGTFPAGALWAPPLG